MTAKERLLSAAKDLLWDYGYEKTSPKDIQKKADVGQGSFYHHFESKESLAAQAVREISDDMQNTLSAVFETDKPPLERVKDYLKQPREALRGCRIGKLVQEVSVPQNSLLPPISEYFARLQQELALLLQCAQQEGVFPLEADATQLAAAISAAVQGGYVLSRALNDPKQMEIATSGILSMIEFMERRL
ncbi:TetR/AcrR family transcriptional regulator [Paenibacillus sp. VCA1]|uniref:TetR/AcrR family transcriptional regulator n=1 Tax=Paenibacillus sp. VCA1 TaxID=3039148 RepID=UPI00287198A5|nr:TetR/AcrR family transcriptional regulator [Paenibacillus sp. VCA1]MDR9852037.1 TetR/AcrR family transcriptional regulator [Paenibacillus sp. VCA1]